MRTVALACAAAGLLVLSAAAPARAATPLPSAEPGRAVYDVASVMQPADASQIETTAAELREKTGVSIVVVTVPALVDETIADLAVRAGKEWGIGRKGEDRGIVVAF